MPIKFERKERLYRRLKKMAPAAAEELGRANRETADEIASMMRQFSQSDTVRATIGVEPAGARGGFLVVAGDQSSISYKGRYPFQLAIGEEFGTGPHVVGGMFAGAQHPGTEARPFFYPAYRLGAKRHKGRASRAISKSIRKAGQ